MLVGEGKMIFCTLLDSNYLDKGLALYKSMRKHIDAFRLYIFAFDDKCFDILSAMRLKNVIVLSIEDIMTETMQQIKRKRTRAEFCWTSTPVVIEHVLIKYHEEICTFIDADIYFFADPGPVIQEIIDAKCSVGLVEHKFERNAVYGEKIFNYGRYCIQFNTFLNNEEGRRVLEDWKEDCLNWCYDRYEDGRFGDQKYSDKWQQKYSGVHVTTYIGAGVAPWNLHIYTDICRKNGGVWMKYRNKPFQIIFYHYAGIEYLDAHRICLNLWKYGKLGTDRKKRILYGEYFRNINQIRRKLKTNYGITFDHMIVNKADCVGRKYSLKQFSIIMWKKQAEKKAGQYLLMDQWVRLKQEGKNLESYFVKNHYKRIAVFGLGHIGKRLLNELKDSEIQVIYAIERKVKRINSDIKVVTLAARMPNVDAVVVTVIEGFDDVSEILVPKVKCPVIAIEDILNEI